MLHLLDCCCKALKQSNRNEETLYGSLKLLELLRDLLLLATQFTAPPILETYLKDTVAFTT